MNEPNSNTTNVIAMRSYQDQSIEETLTIVPNALQLDLIPSVQPDLFADLAFELGFGR